MGEDWMLMRFTWEAEAPFQTFFVNVHAFSLVVDDVLDQEVIVAQDSAWVHSG